VPKKRFPRVQSILLPILRDAFPDWERHQIGSWVEDIDFRTFPMINVRRIGGARNKKLPFIHGKPVVEMTVYSDEDVETAEEIYEDALDAIIEAIRTQKLTPKGYLSSYNENMGMTQFSSPFMDSWRVQGLLELGIRPPRTTNQ
jgi:hypothetical protein